MKRFVFSLLFYVTLTGHAGAAVLVLSPDGTYTTKSSLAEAATAADTAGKTVVVTSPQTLTANLVWPADRELQFRKGGYIVSTAHRLTGLKEARPEWFGLNTVPGTTDMSAAVLAATLSGAGTVKFSSTSYRFSINIPGSQAVTWEGEGYGAGSTRLYPLDATHPCFIIKLASASGNPLAVSGWATTLAPKFKRLSFEDPAGFKGRTCAGIWTNMALDIEACAFNNLKYGVINNCAEWSRYTKCYWAHCQFAVFSTTAAPANDPLGISNVATAGNPSEHYFYDCWFNSSVTDYYEDQPDNHYDQTSQVHFINCQFMGQASGPNASIVVLGSLGEITFDKCWWEGRGSNTDVTIKGRVIPTSIIYTEGVSVVMKSCFGVTVEQNPIYVKYARSPRFTSNATYQPPSLILDATHILRGHAITTDAGVISIFRNASAYTNGGTDLSKFTIVENAWPSIPLDGGGMIFPSPVLPVNRFASGGALVNLWTKGTGAGAVSTPFGNFSQTITPGDGFIKTSGYRYNAISGVKSGNGIQSGPFKSVSGHWYVLSFAIRQNSGSDKSFFISPQGTLNSPTQIGWLTVPGDNKWRFYTGLTSSKTGGANAAVVLTNGSGATMGFDISAAQLVAFPSLSAAQQFIRSGLYVDPTIL
ncbi:MAG: hypothetical protein IPQ16_09785 [Geobacteraceae bacterium]|nr:hypothetical protein [Geobacteraceae bacterium]